MIKSGHNLSISKYFYSYRDFFSILILTILFFFFFFLSYQRVTKFAEQIAIHQARTHFLKDKNIRLWASIHGGVYVPADNLTPPNPYLLHIPFRDIKRDDGTLLTLMNPAYIFRQISDQYKIEHGVINHITSLNPIRPENAPFEWERLALNNLNAPDKEFIEFTKVEGKPFLRFMKAFVTEKSCLKCHISQGYREGEIRGGISVTLPLEDLFSWRNENIKNQWSLLAFLWAAGTVLILLNSRKIAREKRLTLEVLDSLKKERDIFIAGPVMILKWRNCGNWPVERVSGNVSDILGYTEKEFLNGTVLYSSIIHNDDFERVENEVKRALNLKKKRFSHEPYRLTAKDGRIVWVLDYTSIEYNGQGDLVSFHGYLVDITSQKQYEEKLERNQYVLNQAQKIANFGVWTFDLERKEFSWSDETYRMFGLEQGESSFSENSFWSLVDPEDRNRVKESYYESIKKRQAFDVVCKFLINDSIVRYIHWRSETFYADDNKPLKSIGTFSDITERKEYEKVLNEINERLAFTISAANLGTWDWDIVTSEVIFNDIWAEMLGYKIEEIEFNLSTWEKLVHPDDMTEVMVILTDHLEGRTPIYRAEHRLRHKSGKWIWILDVGKVISWDREGKPLRALGIHLDITEMKEAKIALEENEHRLRSLINSTPDIICFKDGKGRWLEANSADIELFGLQDIDYHGKTDLELAQFTHPVSKGSFKTCKLSDDMTWEKKELLRTVEVIPRQDGTTSIYDVIKVPLFNPDGTRKGLVVLGRDITSLKETENELLETNKRLEKALDIAKEMAEKAREASHAKSVFLSNMSHELRTPLNAIIGYAQLLAQDTDADRDKLKGIEIIEQSAEHLLLIINDILDLSKIEAGKTTLTYTPFRLKEFLNGIVNIISLRTKDKGLDFIYEDSDNLPDLIEADEVRLRQVLLNLLSNAVKFTSSGFCALKVKCLVEAKEACLTFMVEDTGVGVSEDIQDKIFEPFHQAGDRLHHAEGTGLGLGISRDLVRLMGGELEVLSPLFESPVNNQGGGSRFYFTLHTPLISSIASCKLKERLKISGYTSEEGGGVSKKILIVDDNESNRKVVRDSLEATGFMVDEAQNGSYVMETCEKFKPDLVLMDIFMPGTDGLATAEVMKDSPGTANIPLIAMTASTSIFDNPKYASKKEYFNGVIVKPYDLHELLKMIAGLLRLSHLYSENDERQKCVSEKNIVFPPEEKLTELLEAVQLGDIMGTLQQVETLSFMDSGRYEIFASFIRELADDCRLMEIENFILSHSKE